MSDASTTDDDEVEEMDLPSWVREAASRCPGLVSEASLAKRKREQEDADFAFAQQLQRDEEAAAESERRAAAEQLPRANAGGANAGPAQMTRETEIIFLSDSDSTSPPPPLRTRPNPPRLQVARSPLSPLNSSSPRQHVPPKRRHDPSLAQTALEGQARDHQAAAGGLAPPPVSLRVASLYPYQAAGFTWMLQREGVGGDTVENTDKRVLGGLLADEQGMGKTIQALSLCLAHPPPLHVAPVGGSLSCAGGGSRAALGTLIVCPLSLLRQWQREIGSKAAPPYGANGAQPYMPQPYMPQPYMPQP